MQFIASLYGCFVRKKTRNYSHNAEYVENFYKCKH